MLDKTVQKTVKNTDQCMSYVCIKRLYLLLLMDDLQFYVLFNSLSVISGQWEVDNERLCAMELCLWL